MVNELSAFESTAVSTNSVLRSSDTMSYSFKYEVNKENQYSGVAKRNNRILSLIDLHSLDPASLSVQISSANFGVGNYPDLVRHAWVVRAHDGFHLTLSFDFVEVEKDQDVIKVYKYNGNGDKEIVDRVDVANEFEVESNRILVVFKSDCSVNRKGFRATVRAVGREGNKATSPELKNYKSEVSTEGSFESTTSENTTSQITTTQKTTPEVTTTQKTTPEVTTTEKTTPQIIITQKTTP